MDLAERETWVNAMRSVAFTIDFAADRCQDGRVDASWPAPETPATASR